MAKVLYTGGRLCSVRVITPGANEVTYSWWNHAYADVALAMNGVTAIDCYDPASAPLLVAYEVPAGHSFYFHGTFSYSDGMRGNNDFLYVVDAAGHPWLKVGTDPGSNTLVALWYNSGSGGSPAWTQLGVSVPFPGYGSGYAAMDIKLDIDAGGNHTVLFALNNVANIGPIGFTAAGLTNAAGVQFFNSNIYSAPICWSELLMTEDWSTVGAHVATTRPTGAGSDTGWTGVYTDVNEQVTNDTTVNQAFTAGLNQTYPQTDITVPDGYLIAGWWNWLRCKNDGTAPENIQSICRPASTDHVSADLGAVAVTFASNGAQYPQNPDTSAAWTQSDVNAGQLGFASAT